MGESSQESQELDNLLIDSTTPLNTRDNGWTWKRLSIKSTTQQSLDFKLWSCQPSLDNVQITRKELRISLAICPGTNKAPYASWCLCTSQSSFLHLQDMWQPKTINPWQLGLQPRHPLELLWHRWLMISWLTNPSKLTTQQPRHCRPRATFSFPQPAYEVTPKDNKHWWADLISPPPLQAQECTHTYAHAHTSTLHAQTLLSLLLPATSNHAAWRTGKEAEFFYFFEEQ